ncbi:MAG: YihY/virulence factor BrkB family protein [Desulfobulbaceae bacterium]|nr:YihY/virulence factor BrkB family protein [Desulfobulbaceae bacterium]
MKMPSWLEQKSWQAKKKLSLAGIIFFRIDGVQWAGAFAFNAFFSLFPIMILLVTLTSYFVDQNSAEKAIISYMEGYLPIGAELQKLIFTTITGVIKAREKAGAIAFIILLWGALQCFTTLISATNRAWGAAMYNWWRMPLKSLLLLSITASGVLLGLLAPVLAKMTKDWLFPGDFFRSWVSALGSFVIPLVVMFCCLSLFYRLAPGRPTRLAEVWGGALVATFLLQASENLFVLYLNNFATLNAVYGTFGGIMALLLWIYFTGCIFIFGACLGAAQVTEDVVTHAPAQSALRP